jgi:ankyrin repeat protein
MIAASDGRADVVRLLVARHADIGAKEPSTQRTALDFAIANDQQEAAKILREARSR